MKTLKALTFLSLTAVLLTAACIDFGADTEEFCKNVDSQRRSDICQETVNTTPDAGYVPACISPSDCTTPSNQCHETAGDCVSGKCVYPEKPSGSTCQDAIPSNTCQNTSGSCESGECHASLKAKGEACDDGQFCTDNDKCDDSGNCIGGTPHACTTTAQCREAVGTCADGACRFALNAEGTSCNDGIPCTENDKCNSAGVCAGTAKVCASGPQCYHSSGTCNTSTGACEYSPTASGVSCTDGDNCSYNDVCNGKGNCISGPIITCENRTSECYLQTGCETNGACSYTYQCTSSESCQNGSCCEGCRCRSLPTPESKEFSFIRSFCPEPPSPSSTP